MTWPKTETQCGFELGSLLIPPKTTEVTFDEIVAKCEDAMRKCLLPIGYFVADRDHDVVRTGVLKGTLTLCPDDFDITIGFDAPDPYRSYAVLHNINEATVGDLTRRRDGQGLAALRNELALATERKPKRPTATTRELAKGHPNTWPSQEGEE
jgi:hypothetical protein